MIFVVEAWFHNSEVKNILTFLCRSLVASGFTVEAILTLKMASWNHVQLSQHKVFVGLGTRTEDHCVVTVMARVAGSEGYLAFEQVFINLLRECQDAGLAELLFSIRNPQPYPFLTHSFFRFSMPPTLHDCEKNRVIQMVKDDYWEQLGPELHFIADEVFRRTSVDVAMLAHYLNVAAIDLKGGVLFDCGWTNEFLLPSQMLSL